MNWVEPEIILDRSQNTVMVVTSRDLLWLDHGTQKHHLAQLPHATNPLGEAEPLTKRALAIALVGGRNILPRFSSLRWTLLASDGCDLRVLRANNGDFR